MLRTDQIFFCFRQCSYRFPFFDFLFLSQEIKHISRGHHDFSVKIPRRGTEEINRWLQEGVGKLIAVAAGNDGGGQVVRYDVTWQSRHRLITEADGTLFIPALRNTCNTNHQCVLFLIKPMTICFHWISQLAISCFVRFLSAFTLRGGLVRLQIEILFRCP